MTAFALPVFPPSTRWVDGLELEPGHFVGLERQAPFHAHLSSLFADPWPWGFLSFRVDETALASGHLRISCEGKMPDGTPFARASLAQVLGPVREAERVDFHVAFPRDSDSPVLALGASPPAERILPAVRIVGQGGVWGLVPDWSPPAMFIGPDHPMRDDLRHQLGALAALAAGFMATLRMPGAEERPAARLIGQVSPALAQGVGVLELLLAAPAVSPGRLAIEALRLAIGVCAAAGTFDSFVHLWDAGDQRGSMRRLLYEAESTASGIGLPFRATPFQSTEAANRLVAAHIPPGPVLLVIEAQRPADLIGARAWLEGASVAAPDRIEEALTRRVAGSRRTAVDRDPHLGVASGPLVALYQLSYDAAWRGGQSDLVLASQVPPPPHTSFLVFLPEAASASSSSPAPASVPAYSPLRGGPVPGGVGS